MQINCKLTLQRTRLSRLLGYLVGQDRACVAFNGVQPFGKRLAALLQLAHLSEKIDLAAGRQGGEEDHKLHQLGVGRRRAGCFQSPRPWICFDNWLQ